MKDFDLNSRGNQLDVLAADTVHGTKAERLPSLNTSALRSVSKQIAQINPNKYQVVLSSNSVTASSIVNKLLGSNSDIYDVVYSEELDEDDDLINKSAKPLWSVSKVGNVVQISRIK